ncbi:acyltransferase family protein [Actinoplanes sp. NPDC051859]|uniref:acyltransferase family protein n=1 Tax=Actinoplanes sp. NPDC051859 TaxID=3363909 RepID=UPI00378C810E
MVPQQYGWHDSVAREFPTVAPKARAGWADVAKGCCILLVVLWHVIMKHYLQIDWQLSLPLPGLWGFLGDQLLPLRMPVFFTISGMFAASAVLRPWRVVARSRIAKFSYLYALWFAVHTVVLALVPRFDTLAAHSVRDVVEQLTITPTNLWYLVALAGYFVVAKLTWRLPVAAVLGPALLLSAVASAGLLAAPGNRGQLYQNLFFFLAGLRLKPFVERWARMVNTRMLWIGGSGYLAVMLVLGHLGVQRWFGVWPAVSVLAVLVGIAAAVHLERLRRIGGLLARLGRTTLPIYVLHMPLLALLHAVLLGPFSRAGTLVQLVLAVLLPVALTALLVVVCLTLHGWVQAVGGHWMFDLPERKSAARPGPGWHAAPELPLQEGPPPHVVRPGSRAASRHHQRT